MRFLNVPIVSWTNGTIMIGVFLIVIIGLVVTVLLLMNSDKPKE
ncbi:hypothetical protein [uncultured Polaribacter sp.]|nr:hypothetical protein [uncultured Polaribacter sp.]